jgi:Pvc16 N-terminal domain
MSNSLAIAAITSAIRNLLDSKINASLLDDPSTDVGLAGTSVSTKSPDKARTGSGNQVNVFLCQTMPNAAWRNMDLPQQSKPNEVGRPPLALNLMYLISAFGNADDEQLSQRLLGRSMSVLHDHAVLSGTELKAALAGSDVGDQIERIRITPQLLSIEEISKLWAAFQTPYRVSAAYQVSVVLIDSNVPTKAALPVLKRGQDNRGVSSQAELSSPYPNLLSLLPPHSQANLRLGETLKIEGDHLGGTSQGVLLRHTRWETGVELSPALGGSDTELSVLVPNLPVNWPAGFYTLSVLVQRPLESYRRATNELPFALAPKIISAMPMAAGIGGALSITCSPEVLPSQRVSLLVGDREVLAQAHATQTDTLNFVMPADLSGSFFVRLRVDGVDSQLVTDFEAALPEFDPTQKVSLT